MSRKAIEDRARGERMLAQALEHVRQAEMAADAAFKALHSALHGREWRLEHDAVARQKRAAASVRAGARREFKRLSDDYHVKAWLEDRA